MQRNYIIDPLVNNRDLASHRGTTIDTQGQECRGCAQYAREIAGKSQIRKQPIIFQRLRFRK